MTSKTALKTLPVAVTDILGSYSPNTTIRLIKNRKKLALIFCSQWIALANRGQRVQI